MIYSYHVMLGIAVIASVCLFVYDLVATGEFYWFGAKQIPNALRYVMAESKAWFKLGPEPKNPILYDPKKKDYAFKIIPSVVTSFLGFDDSRCLVDVHRCHAGVPISILLPVLRD